MKVANGSVSVIGAWGYPHLPQYPTGNPHAGLVGPRAVLDSLRVHPPITARPILRSVTGVLLSPFRPLYPYINDLLPVECVTRASGALNFETANPPEVNG